MIKLSSKDRKFLIKKLSSWVEETSLRNAKQLTKGMRIPLSMRELYKEKNQLLFLAKLVLLLKRDVESLSKGFVEVDPDRSIIDGHEIRIRYKLKDMTLLKTQSLMRM